jgi:hypothetical protein
MSGLGISYRPPTENLAIFDSSVFLSNDLPITYNNISANFLRFPIAQGEETIPDLIVPGTSQLTTVQSSNVTLDGVTGEYTIISPDQILMGDSTGFNSSTLTSNDLVFASAGTGTQTSLAFNSLTLSNATTTNTLTVDSWSGQIQTVNTTANLTHYLNFSDSSGTGYGRPQKTASLNCNPFTGIITANSFVGPATRLTLTSSFASTFNLTMANVSSGSAIIYTDSTNRVQFNTTTGVLTAPTFSGSLSGTATSAVSITLTSDNTNGAYYIPFSKSAAGSGLPLFVDDVTSPFTYNPSTGVLTATSLAGTSNSALSINTVSDNSATTCYIPFSKSAAGPSTNLYLDDTTTALTYNPSTAILTAGTFAGSLQYDNTANAIGSFTTNTLTIVCSGLSVRNFTWTLTGTTNNLVGLTITSSRVNGMYTVGILNSGSGALTINPTLVGTNIKTRYTSVVTVPAGGFGILDIQILSIGGTSYQVVDAYNIA